MESELAKIPECMKSDRILYESSCGSLTEVKQSIANFKGKSSALKFNIYDNKEVVSNSRNKSFNHHETAENTLRLTNRGQKAQKVRNRYKI